MTVDPKRPIVIGHRGAAGYRPEHTAAAYELAVRMGADYLEPDLVSTRDGVLVARHECEIGATTDVAGRAEFADRATSRVIDGEALTGWFAEDFTLAELKTLRARERIPELRRRNTLYDGRQPVLTFAEILQLRERLSAEVGREIGIVAEIKHATHLASIGLPLLEPLVADLAAAGLNRPDAPVVVESFETAILRALRPLLRVRQAQLLDAGEAPADLVAAGTPRTGAELATPAGLAEIAGYADAIGPAKDMVIPRDGADTLAAPAALVVDAHAAGLLVYVWTFRNENLFLPAELRRDGSPADYGDAFAEYAAFFTAGVDGVFSDNPDTAVAARAAWWAGVA